MHGDSEHALAVVQRPCDQFGQFALVRRIGYRVADRQLDVVLLIALESRPGIGRQQLAVDAQLGVPARGGPLGEFGVVALAPAHQRCVELQPSVALLAQKTGEDRLRRLRFDGDIAVRAVLSAEFDEQQAQEVMDFGQRGDGAFAPAAAGALLDRDGRRNTGDGVDLGPRRWLHELARIGVERLEIAPLTFIEQNIEGDGAFAGAGHAGDHREALARDAQLDAFEVVFAGVVNTDGVVALGRRMRMCRHIPEPFQRRGIVAQCSAGMRGGTVHDCLRRSRGDEPATALPAFRAEIDKPVGGTHDVEVVFDHHQRMSLRHQTAERAEQTCDVLEMQAGGRLVEQEQLPAHGAAGKVLGKLEALRLAAGQRRHRLAQVQILQADCGERFEYAQDVRRIGKECQRLGDGELEHICDRQGLLAALAVHPYIEHFVAIPSAVAVRAAQVDVGQELHLDMFEAGARTGRTAPVARIEAEGAGGIAALARQRIRGKTFADGIEGADIAGRIGARGLADRTLVDQHHAVKGFGAADLAMRAGLLLRLALHGHQCRIQHVADQRGLAGARHAGDADQTPEGNADVDVAQVVFADPKHFQP